jgi:cytoskeletal protein CcmA (bactofilin family)
MVGSVTADGLVEINGQVVGEVCCTSLVISRKGLVAGTIVSERVVVDGRVDGPTRAAEVVLKSQAHVVGDIYCQSLVVEKGAFMEGRMARISDANGAKLDSAKLLGKGFIGYGRDQAAAAEAETSTRLAELTVEARHLSGNPDLLSDEALAFLAKRGHVQAKAFLDGRQVMHA